MIIYFIVFHLHWFPFCVRVAGCCIVLCTYYLKVLRIKLECVAEVASAAIDIVATHAIELTQKSKAKTEFNFLDL
jgi:hypothetical protein